MSELTGTQQGEETITPEQASAAEVYGQLNDLVAPYIEAYTDEGLPLSLLQAALLDFQEVGVGVDRIPRKVSVMIGAIGLTPKDDQTVYYLFDQGRMVGYDIQPTQVTPPLQLDSLGKVNGREYVDNRFEEIKDMIGFIGAHGTKFKGITLVPRYKAVK